MKRTKAAWLTRGSAIALIAAAGIALSACQGNDGLSKAEEEALQQQVEEEKKKAEEAERKRQEEEEARKKAEEAKKEAERKGQEAETQRQEEEEKRQEAERERQRLAEEAEKAQQAASRAQAKAAFDGLGGRADDGTRTDPGDVTVAPRYGQTATVTTTPAVTFETKRRSTSGRWSITTLSNDGSTHKDDLVVYSDLGAPTRVLITEHSDHMSDFSAVDDTNNIRATLSFGNTNPIASSRFPGGGRSTTFEHTIDSDLIADGTDGDSNTRNDYDTTRFSGTYDGASGTFECTGTCTVAHEGGSTYNLSSGTWTFTTSKTARVSVDDGSYMNFGWWKREQKSDETLSFEMFSGGKHEVGNVPDTLTGTATYTGPAVGQYAVYQPLGTQSESGSFTARAQLTANFGADDAEGTLSGRVTNFSNASDWSVTLNSETIDGGAVADGDVSWMIAGNTEDGGMWDAKFFSDVDGFAGYPEGVAGTFDAKFGTVGRLIGAFGAHCPTSTCPRN